MPTREDWQQGGHLRPLPCGPLWSGGSQVTNHVLPAFTDLALEGRPTGREPQPNRRPGKVWPWPVAGAEVGGLPSRPQQDGTSESKQDRSQGKGLLGFLDEHDPGAKARNEGGAAGVGRPWGDPAENPASSRDVPRRTAWKQGATTWRVSLRVTCVRAPARTRTRLRASAVGRGTPTRRLYFFLFLTSSVPVGLALVPSNSQISAAHNDARFLLTPSMRGWLSPRPCDSAP